MESELSSCGHDQGAKSAAAHVRRPMAAKAAPRSEEWCADRVTDGDMPLKRHWLY
jgi:hypothetical protein